MLIILLALVVVGIATASLLLRRRPEVSYVGMGITVAALIVMPLLAAAKRRESKRTGNKALAADAVQSATCAYLALITLSGLAVNAFFGIAWIDSVAALVAIPFLVKESREAWQGHSCSCC